MEEGRTSRLCRACSRRKPEPPTIPSDWHRVVPVDWTGTVTAETVVDGIVYNVGDRLRSAERRAREDYGDAAVDAELERRGIPGVAVPPSFLSLTDPDGAGLPALRLLD